MQVQSYELAPPLRVALISAAMPNLKQALGLAPPAACNVQRVACNLLPVLLEAILDIDSLLSSHAGFVLGERLRDAVDKGELKLAYQPLVDPVTNEVKCFEALLRWHDEEEGDISPARFIPIAENDDLIIKLRVTISPDMAEGFYYFPVRMYAADGVDVTLPGFVSVRPNPDTNRSPETSPAQSIQR